jgi:hypothetical protein
MMGQYNYNVQNARLRLYHVVAKGLAARFLSVSYQLVTREQNQHFCAGPNGGPNRKGASGTRA